jgi:quinol monooxygenase YgiN
MPKTIRVVALMNVRPEKLEDTLNSFDSLVAATRQEEGCITYELLQNVEDPHDLTFVEEWASAEALQVHFETEHFKAVAARAAELLAAPPDIRRYTVIK